MKYFSYMFIRDTSALELNFEELHKISYVIIFYDTRYWDYTTRLINVA